MIKSITKRILPNNVRNALRECQKVLVYFWRSQRIKLPVTLGKNIKIIVGAAMTSQSGWLSTNEQWLDITNPTDWKRVFRGRVLLINVLAEHVFEHLSEQDMRGALDLIYQHMQVGGRVRIAVPDGYNPDSTYIKHVKIAGIGADAEDHKQLINCDSLVDALQASGFSAQLVEGYRRNGELVVLPVDRDAGFVSRSRSNPISMSDRTGWAFPDANTSLIVDCVKTA